MTKLGCICLLSILCLINSAPTNDGFDYKAYLEKYGYIDVPSTDSNIPENLASLHSENSGDDMREALVKFQKMANIPITGILDDITKEKFRQPRCGMSDYVKTEPSRRHKRFFVWKSKWNKKILTYRIELYTNDLSKGEIDNVTRKAFDMWAKVSTLRFNQVISSSSADIVIKFVSGDHGDGTMFDGAGGVLAHAFYPSNGRVHFDDDEVWTLTTGPHGHYNLLQVMVHELGHTFGLRHSGVDDAVMAPYYNGYDEFFRLHFDDIDGIQALYGIPVTQTTTSSIETTNNLPTTKPILEICNNQTFDAIFRKPGSQAVGFIGKYYVEIGHNGILPGYPKLIRDDWGGVPDNVDAAVTIPRHRIKNAFKTFIFKGNYFWKFRDDKFVAGPLLTSNYFKHNPRNIDFMFYYPPHRKTYFFKNGMVYRLQSIRSKKTFNPKPISSTIWRHLSGLNITATFFYDNEWDTFYFSEGKVYRLDFTTNVVSFGYPKNTGTYWLGCN